MNKKTLAIIGVITVLLIGIMSAGLLDYFGKITGSVKIEGPVFYLDGEIGGSYYNLLINELPPSKKDINWFDGETIKFKSDSLNVDYFYDAKFNFIFYAKANATDRRVQMRVTKLNGDGSQGEEICVSETIAITATKSYSDYELSCTSDGEISLDENQGFVLEIFGLGENITDEYWLSTGDNSRTYGASRIEVSAT
jgi:hypothetical protein